MQEVSRPRQPPQAVCQHGPRWWRPGALAQRGSPVARVTGPSPLPEGGLGAPAPPLGCQELEVTWRFAGAGSPAAPPPSPAVHRCHQQQAGRAGELRVRRLQDSSHGGEEEVLLPGGEAVRRGQELRRLPLQGGCWLRVRPRPRFPGAPGRVQPGAAGQNCHVPGTPCGSASPGESSGSTVTGSRLQMFEESW